MRLIVAMRMPISLKHDTYPERRCVDAAGINVKDVCLILGDHKLVYEESVEVIAVRLNIRMNVGNP